MLDGSRNTSASVRPAGGSVTDQLARTGHWPPRWRQGQDDYVAHAQTQHGYKPLLALNDRCAPWPDWLYFDSYDGMRRFLA